MMIFDKTSVKTLSLGVIIFGVFTGLMFAILGLPTMSLAEQFIAGNPSPTNALSFVSLFIWSAFFLIGLYALLSGAGTLHKKWVYHYRQEQMELLLGLMGAMVFTIGLLHGQTIHASSSSQLLQFILKK